MIETITTCDLSLSCQSTGLFRARHLGSALITPHDVVLQDLFRGQFLVIYRDTEDFPLPVVVSERRPSYHQLPTEIFASVSSIVSPTNFCHLNDRWAEIRPHIESGFEAFAPFPMTKLVILSLHHKRGDRSGLWAKRKQVPAICILAGEDSRMVRS